MEDIQSVNNSFEKEPSNSVLNLDDDSSQKPNLDLERNPNRQKATDLSLNSINDYPDEIESNSPLEDIDSVDKTSERELSNSLAIWDDAEGHNSNFQPLQSKSDEREEINSFINAVDKIESQEDLKEDRNGETSDENKKIEISVIDDLRY